MTVPINRSHPRQDKIIRYLVINDQIDNEQCQSLCNSIKRTATRDLTGLVEKTLLIKHGGKKGTYYFLSPEISIKIRDIKGHDYVEGFADKWAIPALNGFALSVN